MESKKIVVALGGNALQMQGKAASKEQQAVAKETVSKLFPLIDNGHSLAIVHGNGPQVGNIILHEEAIDTVDVPSLPLDDCGAMSQGLIGFWLQKAFNNAFRQNNLNKSAVSFVTETVVDKEDPAFANPTKPIGPFYTKEEAKLVSEQKGYIIKEDAGRGYRRVVPSPKPKYSVEAEGIKQSIESGCLVISTGGGGIPVVETEEGLVGVEAVIDKDFGASKLADILDYDILLILTSVDAAKINYGKENEESLHNITTSEALQYIDEGQFASGSMLPKVQAAIEFVNKGEGRKAIIASLDNVEQAIAGNEGTIITK